MAVPPGWRRDYRNFVAAFVVLSEQISADAVDRGQCQGGRSSALTIRVTE